MKIKVKEMDYDAVRALKAEKRKAPRRPVAAMQLLVRLASIPDLKAVHFSYQKIHMERLGKKEPCLILMNHSSFLDLKIASKLLFPRKYAIVCTSDGFVGKEKLMRAIGCIPTQKFVADTRLVSGIMHLIKKEHCSVLMFPEASYSFDGTATPLPESLGKLVKLLDVPVVMIKTEGAFARDPLYNNLQLRKVDVFAKMEYLLSAEDIREKSAVEINALLKKEFTFDYFKWQQENRVRIAEDFRADDLNRVLYKCPHCQKETGMVGKGTTLTCRHCKNEYELTEYGFLENKNGETKFSHVPDWYRWQRECVKKELENGTYRLDTEVSIYMLVDTKCIYHVGTGRLVHDKTGFCLDGCDGRLHYEQKPLASYSLYSDFYWYEIGDMICIGDRKVLYYCFPTDAKNVVAKTRLAVENLYKMCKEA